MPENPFARDPAVTVGVGADTDGFGEAIDGAISQLGDFKGAVAGVGVVLGGLATGALAKATSAAADFEEQMVEVEKVTSPEVAAEMTSRIQEMAAAMPVAQRELAGIAAQAGRFGVEGSANIERFTESVAKMAVATDMSTSQAGEAFARMTTLMEEPIENVESIGDAVNALSNNMATSASEITNAATRSSGALSQLGLQSEQILALNASMNEVSASSRIAGTRLRRFAQEIQAPGKTSDLAAALGMTTDEFERMREEVPNDLMEEMVARFEEGGESADALRSALSTTSRQALAGLAQNTESWSTAQKVANKQMEDGTSLQEEYEAAASTFNSRVQVMRNRLRNIAIQIGNNVLPVMADLVGVLNDGLTAFTAWNKQSNGMLATIGLVATALGGFVAAGAATISMLGGLSAVTGAVGAALTVLTGPIGIAIAAVALLAGAWTSNMGDIQGHTRRTLSTVRAVIKSALSKVQTYWDQNGASIVSTVRSSFNTVRRTISSVLSFVWTNLIKPTLSRIRAAWAENGQDIMNSARRAFNNVRDKIQTVLSFLWSTVIKPYLGYIQAAWDAFGDDILAVTRDVFDLIMIVVDTSVSNLLELVDLALDLLAGDWEGAWTSIKNITENTFNGIIEFLEGSVSLLSNAIGLLVNAIKFPFEQLYNWLFGNSLIKDLIRDPANWLQSTGKNLMEGAFGTITNAIESALNAISLSGVSNTIQGIVEAAKDAVDWLKKAASTNINIDWPEPPAIVRKALNGNLNIDWPDPPSFLGGGGGGGGGGDGGDGGGGDDGGGSGGGGGGGGCFTGGMLVETPDGPCEIRDIDPGDTVTSFDAASGEFDTSVVGDVLVHDHSEHDYERHPLLAVTVTGAGGETSTTRVTANHLYYSATHGEYRSIGDLPEGTTVSQPEGEATITEKAVLEEQPDVVYNLHMESGPHSYLVDGVAVHNAKTPMLSSGGFIESAGAAILHAGERVVPAAEVDRGPGPERGLNIERIEIHANDREGGREAGKALRDELKRFDV